MFRFFKKHTIILLSILLLILSSCENGDRIGSCTSDPGEGSLVVSSKPTTVFSNGSQDLWQTQLADWHGTPYYTNGEDIIINIATGALGSVNTHGDNAKHPCNICSKIVKYNANGSIAYQTPNCICGPKIYGPPSQIVQSFRYLPSASRGEDFKPIETIKPECEIILGYQEKAHYGIINNNERITCTKPGGEVITVNSGKSVETVPNLAKTDIISQQYTCIPMDWALNLGGSTDPNFTQDTKIASFLNENYIEGDKYYSKATNLLIADFRNISSNKGDGYQIVHFPVNYYEKELNTTETDQAKITQLKDVNYHNVTSCTASNGFSLYLGLFPENSDMPGYSNNIYAYHLYSFDQICRSFRNGVCENAVTRFKLSSPKSDPSSILPNAFSDNGYTIPEGYKIKFKIYDNYYTDNKTNDGYKVEILSGVNTQNSAQQSKDEGIISNTKNSLDIIFTGAQSYNFNISNINFASFFISSAYAEETFKERTYTEQLADAKKNGLIRVTYDNFITKNIIIIRLTLVLFLVFYAASYLMGLSEINQKELILRVFKIAIVFAFLDPALINLTEGENVITPDIAKTYKPQEHTTVGFLFYQKYVVSIVIDGLNSLVHIVAGFCEKFTDTINGAGGLQREDISFSQNVNFVYFDKILENIFSIKTVGAIVSAIFTKWLVGAVLLVVFLYFVVKTVFKLLITYILNWLQIILALSIGPIFFLFLLFSKTKGFFTKWVAFTFARGLDVVILFALTFPFLNIIYTDLLSIINQDSCLRSIGPSFLKINIWLQGDNDVNTNFFDYIFVLARGIALVYMTNLIASYAPQISGKIINIADNQNSAQLSGGASNLAAQTTQQALTAIASGIKFANSSYVGNMAKSYIKQGAYGLSNFVGTTRAAKFAKTKANNLGNQIYEGLKQGLTVRNASETLFGKEITDSILGKKPTQDATPTGRDSAVNSTGASTVAGADVSTPVGLTFTASDTASDDDTTIPSERKPRDSTIPKSTLVTTSGGSVRGDFTPTTIGPKIPSQPSLIQPAGDSSSPLEQADTGAGMLHFMAEPQDGVSSVAAASEALPPAFKTAINALQLQSQQLQLQSQQHTGAGLLLGDKEPTLQQKLDILQRESRNIVDNLTQNETDDTQKNLRLNELHNKISQLAQSALDDPNNKSELEENQNLNTTLSRLKQKDIEALNNFIGLNRLPGGANSAVVAQHQLHQAPPPPPSKFESSPPTKQPLGEKTHSASPANNTYSPAMVEKLTSGFKIFYDKQEEEFKQQLSLENALELFIKANDAELKKLQEQFTAMSNPNEEEQLRSAFHRFKTDFTTIQQSITSSSSVSETTIKVEDIAKQIIANDNSKPQVSEEAKQKTFSQIAEKLQSQTIEEAKQQELIAQIEVATNTTSATTEQTQSLEELKTALSETSSKSTAEKTNILAQFLAQKENKALKTLVEEELKKPAEGETEPQKQERQERVDYFNRLVTVAQLNSQAEYTIAKKQQVLVEFLAKQEEKLLDKILTQTTPATTDDQTQERNTFIKEIKEQVIKQQTFSQIAEKLQSQTIEEAKQQAIIENIEVAINTTSATTEQKQSLTKLKTELPSKSTAEKTNILAQFFAKKENKALKTLVEEELKKPAEGQERVDYFNRLVTIAQLNSQAEYTTQEKQQVLVELLADPAKEKQSTQLEKILEEIKKEAEKEVEDKKQEARVDHLQEIYSQTERVKALTQYYTEKDTSDVSQEELQALQESPIFNKQQKTQIEEFVKLQESLKSANINIDQLDAPEIQENLTEQQKKIVEDYLIKKQEISEITIDVIIQDERITQQLSSAPTREEIANQKKQFETILKLMGIKYKSDRNKALNFIFGETAETPTDIKTKLDKMYTSLEKPLTMMNKKEDILEKIIVSINSEIEAKEPSARTAKEKLTLQKNKNTLTRIQRKKQSLGALLARIKKAIEKSS